MLSYYVIYYEKLKKLMLQTKNEALKNGHYLSPGGRVGMIKVPSTRGHVAV